KGRSSILRERCGALTTGSHSTGVKLVTLGETSTGALERGSVQLSLGHISAWTTSDRLQSSVISGAMSRNAFPMIPGVSRETQTAPTQPAALLPRALLVASLIRSRCPPSAWSISTLAYTTPVSEGLWRQTR